jgi:hypothetical protein
MARLYCVCGKWEKEISNESILHWIVYDCLPPCPNKRWWNAWMHSSLTEMDFLVGVDDDVV